MVRALGSSCCRPALPYRHVPTECLQLGHDALLRNPLPEGVKPGFLQLCVLWFAALGPGTEQAPADVAPVLERSILEICCLARDGSVLLPLAGGTWGTPLSLLSLVASLRNF